MPTADQRSIDRRLCFGKARAHACVWDFLIVAVAWIAISATSDLASAADSRTPTRMRSADFGLSRLYSSPKQGVAWRARKDGLPSEARFANDLASNAFVAKAKDSRYAGLSRGIAIDDDVGSLGEDASFGLIDFAAQTQPGALSPAAAARASALAFDLERRLMRMGADRLWRDDNLSGRAVRDRATTNETRSSNAVAGQETPEQSAFYAPPNSQNLASIGPPADPVAKKRPLAFDASEGTLLDPLLNKTYDLYFAKTVPSLKTSLSGAYAHGAD
jgi:hypothetical protein